MNSQSTGSTERNGPPLSLRAAALLRDVRDLAYDHLELAALEAQRASAALIRMVGAAIAISVLWVTAWLALVAGAIVWATSSGVSWPGALAVAALINALAGGALVLWARSQTGELLFAATLRQLRRQADPSRGDAL